MQRLQSYLNRHHTMGWRGGTVGLGAVQFHEEHHVSPHKHPSLRAFIPTAPSTKVKLTEEPSSRKGPSRIFDEVSKAAGGVLTCEQSAELPRDSRQVINARQRAKGKAQVDDEFASLLDLSKRDPAVRNLQWTPSPRVVYFDDQQMDDIARECCWPDSAGILSVDTTFNVDTFYVTSTTYQSSKIVSKKTKKSANLPGPAMFHATKTSRDYLYFAHTLLECKYDLERIAFLGGDRDKAQASFMKPLKGCTFLPCKKHVVDDLSRKIADLALFAITNERIHDVFGDEKLKEKGVIDSNTAEEFLKKVESVTDKWDKVEEDITGKEPRFSHYFRTYIQDDMVRGMWLPVRRRAGLKDYFFMQQRTRKQQLRVQESYQGEKVIAQTRSAVGQKRWTFMRTWSSKAVGTCNGLFLGGSCMTWHQATSTCASLPPLGLA